MPVQLESRERAEAVQSKSILLAEDDRPIRTLVTLILRREPVTVVETSSGVETLERVRREKFDLIVLDLLLPGVDGFEILRRIRTESPNVLTPVLILTALSQGDDVLRGYSLGASRYMKKPFEPSELVSEVRHLCGLERQTANDYPVAIRRFDSGDVTTVEIRGAIDLITCGGVHDDLQERLSGGQRRVIMDVSRVTFLDSAGVGVLLDAWRALSQAGRSLLVVGAPPQIRRVFHIVGLTSILA